MVRRRLAWCLCMRLVLMPARRTARAHDRDVVHLDTGGTRLGGLHRRRRSRRSRSHRVLNLRCPEELLTAATRLIAGEREARAQFEAEPTAYRWIFYREGDDVWIQLLQLPDKGKHDNAGTEIWSSWQTTDTLARAIMRGFDEAGHMYGESGYHGKWRSPFPRAELEALRNTWRHHHSAPPTP